MGKRDYIVKVVEMLMVLRCKVAGKSKLYALA